MNWPRAELSGLISQDRHYVHVLEDRAYKKLSVRLGGRGVVIDAPTDGATVRMNKHQFAKAGQIIVSEIWAKKGAIGIVPPDGEGALVSSHFYLFDIGSDNLSPGWMNWLLRANYFEPQLATEARGSTGYASVRPAQFLATTVPLPPKDVQDSTVARLDSIAEVVAFRHQNAGTVDAETATALRAAFKHIAKDAPLARMGDVAPLVRRPVEIDMDSSYPELGVRSFGKGTFHKAPLAGSDVGSKRLFRIEAGDLLFNIVFAWEGAVAVASETDAGRVGSHRFLTCVADPARTTARFLRYWFLSAEGLFALGKASPGGAGRNRTLGTRALEEILVPLPSLDAQLWFDQLQAKARQARTAQAEATAHLDALLPAMLHEIFGG